MPAYNSYFPATYQGYYQNPYAQQTVPQYQQAQQFLNPTQQTNGIIWVSGDAEADAYPIAPNNAVTLWNRTSPTVYFKQADASGRPSMKVYDLVERKPSSVNNSPKIADVNLDDFATKQDIHALNDIIKSIRGELKEIRCEIEGDSSDQ